MAVLVVDFIATKEHKEHSDKIFAIYAFFCG
jgi:hypothetical protein